MIKEPVTGDDAPEEGGVAIPVGAGSDRSGNASDDDVALPYAQVRRRIACHNFFFFFEKLRPHAALDHAASHHLMPCLSLIILSFSHPPPLSFNQESLSFAFEIPDGDADDINSVREGCRVAVLPCYSCHNSPAVLHFSADTDQ